MDIDPLADIKYWSKELDEIAVKISELNEKYNLSTDPVFHLDYADQYRLHTLMVQMLADVHLLHQSIVLLNKQQKPTKKFPWSRH